MNPYLIKQTKQKSLNRNIREDIKIYIWYWRQFGVQLDLRIQFGKEFFCNSNAQRINMNEWIKLVNECLRDVVNIMNEGKRGQVLNFFVELQN